jgi:POT family proton-dependent oligopeptide transporter
MFGQPSGLSILCLTEMWERFSYYGMRSILILFLTAPAAAGGLGTTDKTASSIYGLYVACSYLLSLLGGWIADRLMGAQRAVIAGGSLIVLGNSLLISGTRHVFFLGLTVSAFGIGLLKPSVSTLVAQLFPEGGSRRDAGFLIFFMGISVGALLGSMLVPIFVVHFGWRWGFGLTAFGMLLGSVHFGLARGRLAGAGAAVTGEAGSWLPVILFGTGISIIAALSVVGHLTIDPIAVSAIVSWLLVLLGATYFIYLVAFAGLTVLERRRAYVIVALFVASAIFFAGNEQSGALLTLFAERYTDRKILGWEIPAGALYAVSSLTDILFAPLFAWLWLALGRRGVDPSTITKFSLALTLLSVGFLVMYVASSYVGAGRKVGPAWLTMTFVLHEWGALCLYPIGLSSITKLAPPRLLGQLFGMWFLSVALGDNLAGRLSGEYDVNNLSSLSHVFLKTFWFAAIGAGMLMLLSPLLTRFMAEVK